MDITYDDNYTFYKLSEVIDSKRMKEIQIINSVETNRPWLVSLILYHLSDDNPNFSMYETTKVDELASLLIRYYNCSWNVFFDVANGSLDLEKLLQHTSQDRYLIEGDDWSRVATKKEVEEAIYEDYEDYRDDNSYSIVKLVNKPILKIEEKDVRFLNTLVWTFTGRWRYYIRAGFKCEYNGNKLKEPEIKYVTNILNVLNRVCELLENPSYLDDIITNIKKIKKAGAYKYPEFANDEVIPREKVVFVVNQLSKLLPKNKSNIQYKAYKILSANKNTPISRYSTEDKLTIRQAYIETKHGITGGEKEDKEIEEVKTLCDKIRQGSIDGIINYNDFAMKIVRTISANGYRRCSIKQKNILVEAVNRIEIKSKTNEQIETVEKMTEANNTKDSTGGIFSIAGISDLLGRGMFNADE